MAANATQLDTHIEVVTPENIAFRYRLAGPSRRVVAYLIDLAIRVGLFIVISLAVFIAMNWLGLPGLGWAAAFALFFVLDWLYGGLFEAYWNGQTPGKRLLHIRVLSIDGRPIDGIQAMLRNVLRAFDALPIIFWVPTCLFGLLSMLLTRRFQRFGDLPSGTMVVIDERSWLTGLVKISDPAALQLAASLPAGYEVSRTLREALATYVERRRFFPPGRRADIARHVGEPLCEKFALPRDTNHDLLLCALYQRTFGATENSELGGPARPTGVGKSEPRPPGAARKSRAAGETAMERPEVGIAPPNFQPQISEFSIPNSDFRNSLPE